MSPLKVSLLRFARGIGAALAAAAITYVTVHLGDIPLDPQYQVLITFFLSPVLQAADKYFRTLEVS